MKSLKLFLFAIGFVVSLSVTSVFGQNSIDNIHFLIPGGAGGGWDGTARGVGEALTKSSLVKNISYENMSGGGGGKAIAYMIETAVRQKETLMVNSTPIVIRSLQKVFPQSFRDLTPVAGVIADFGAIVTRTDSSFKNWEEVVQAFRENPRKVRVAGGSSRGSMDHLVAAMAFKAAGGNPKKVRYIPYDAGGKALAGMLSGETHLLVTGFSEVLNQHQDGQLKILAITADKRSAAAPEIPTLKELGYPAVFANWRGFFGPPGLSQNKQDQYIKIFKHMYQTPQWVTIRDRYGWVELYNSGNDFVSFLEQQEKVMGTLMRELGFLK